MSLVAGVAAILGHNFTCWLYFKGGKGIATSGGVVLAWAPLACLTALALWGVVFVITKFVSLASIAAALVLPVAVWIFSRHSLTMTAVMAALSALAIYKHKGNIQRLLKGTENRAGAKKT
jgi:glycerol-3-phosphate acyltransferase PlsY